MPLFIFKLEKNMKTFYFISNNEQIFMARFYEEILSNFAYDTEYILIITYANTNNLVNKECIVFKLLSKDLDYSIKKLHAYLTEGTNKYNNIEYMDCDD
jgi:hypothetical protein